MPQPPFIEIQHLRKSFKEKRVLEEINLNVQYQDIFGIIGKSGSGKTTLLNILIGFLKPDNGHIVFQSRDIEKDMENVSQQFGFTAQDGSFYPKLSVRENLEYFGSLYNIKKNELKEKIPRMLKSFGLEDSENTLASKLSIGMQKRLDIACGIIHDPKVLLLDEPTENLDPPLRREILTLLHEINKKKNVTIIITSHLLDEVELICNKVAILHKNTILASGTINDVKEKYSKNLEIHLETYSRRYDAIIKELKSKKDVIDISIQGNKLVCYTSKPENVLDFILGLIKKYNEKLMDIDINKPSLNEVFESLTREIKQEQKPAKK